MLLVHAFACSFMEQVSLQLLLKKKQALESGWGGSGMGGILNGGHDRNDGIEVGKCKRGIKQSGKFHLLRTKCI